MEIAARPPPGPDTFRPGCGVGEARRLPQRWPWRSCARPRRRARCPQWSPGTGPGRTCSTRARRARRSSRTPASGAPTRSSSRAASAYRDGEFLYQDYLYDDHGARGVRDPDRPVRRRGRSPSRRSTGRSPTRATACLPNNAADLVELRVKPLADATAFRVTLNTLDRAGAHRLHHRARLLARAARLAARRGRAIARGAVPDGARGDGRAARRGARGAMLTPRARARQLDRDRRQFEVRVPRAAWDPGTRHRADGGGRRPVGRGGRALPRAAAGGNGHGTGRRGAVGRGAVQRRLPLRRAGPRCVASPGVNTIVEGAIGAGAQAAYWRERAQADALEGGDISALLRRRGLRQARRPASNDDIPRRRRPATWTASSRAASASARASTTRSTARSTFSQEFPVQRQLRRAAPAVRGLRAVEGAPGRARLRPDDADARPVGQPQRVHRRRGTSASSATAAPARSSRRRSAAGPTASTQDIAEGDLFEVWDRRRPALRARRAPG